VRNGSNEARNFVRIKDSGSHMADPVASGQLELLETKCVRHIPREMRIGDSHRFQSVVRGMFALSEKKLTGNDVRAPDAGRNPDQGYFQLAADWLSHESRQNRLIRTHDYLDIVMTRVGQHWS
jgi:hypothetical protein